MLLPDWKDILKRAWSVKFLTASAAISAVETLLQISGNTLFPFLPVWSVPAVLGVLNASGILARVLAQKEAEEVAK